MVHVPGGRHPRSDTFTKFVVSLMYDGVFTTLQGMEVHGSLQTKISFPLVLWTSTQWVFLGLLANGKVVKQSYRVRWSEVFFGVPLNKSIICHFTKQVCNMSSKLLCRLFLDLVVIFGI